MTGLLVLAGTSLAAPPQQDGAPWRAVFSDGLLDAQGHPVPLDQLKGKLVGIYFSAHWCPPCRAFTPQLVKFRDAHQSNFEVVFVSFDNNQRDKDQYMQQMHMKWATVPLRSKSASALIHRFHIQGIPTLIVLSPHDHLVTTRGRIDVTWAPDHCLAKWTKQAQKVDAK